MSSINTHMTTAIYRIVGFSDLAYEGSWQEKKDFVARACVDLLLAMVCGNWWGLIFGTS